MPHEVLRKVTAFIVDRATRRLLVFRHPLAGVQLPAGTVEPGEDYTAAARREVLEETGWAVRGEPSLLGVESIDFEGEHGVMLATVSDGITHSSGQPGALLRGHKVRVVQARPSRRLVEVREELFDLTSSPPEVKETIEGWVPARAVGAVIERGFVLFCEEPGARAFDIWSQQADGHTFEVYWAPLDRLTLVAGQDAWLLQYLEQATTALNLIKTV